MIPVPGSEQHADEVLGQQVTYNGERIGIVVQVRHNMENGRRYAFVQPMAPEDPERRIPLDELRLSIGL